MQRKTELSVELVGQCQPVGTRTNHGLSSEIAVIGQQTAVKRFRTGGCLNSKVVNPCPTSSPDKIFATSESRPQAAAARHIPNFPQTGEQMLARHLRQPDATSRSSLEWSRHYANCLQ